MSSIADVVARAVANYLPQVLNSKLTNLDCCFDEKLEAFEKKSHDTDMIQKNKHCLVVSGLPEKESSAPNALTTMLNEQLLPNLYVPDRFHVVHSFRMGKPLSDGSPCLCCCC